jgi:putative transposase
MIYRGINMDNGKEMTPEQEGSDVTATSAPATVAKPQAARKARLPVARVAAASSIKIGKVDKAAKSAKVAKAAAAAKAVKAVGAGGEIAEIQSGKRRRFTTEQKSQLLEDIDRRVSGGGNVKTVLETVGLSPQTYYLWRRSADGKANSKTNGKAGGKLDDLASLEKENVRLKRLLAEKLGKENAILKGRLGV